MISNDIVLDSPDRHLPNNPDFPAGFTFTYDKLGNITEKDGNVYQYDKVNAGPHAVTKVGDLNYTYDAVGNMVSAKRDGETANERTLEWSAFNKPTKITRDGKTVEFAYDANHNRYLKTSSDGEETFYFGKTFERVKNTTTGETQYKHFVYADGKLIALNTQTKDSEDKLLTKQIRYLHYDALNSVDMITDGYGNIVERRSYDVWGKERTVIWNNSVSDPGNVVQATITNRGYTGHEKIEEVGLVHMNGRVYDQEIGRFISADPLIQAPFVTNSFNRYAYVWNNPLKYTDPTGHYSWSEFKSDVKRTWSRIKSFFSGGSSSSSSGRNNTGGSNGGNGDSSGNKDDDSENEVDLPVDEPSPESKEPITPVLTDQKVAYGQDTTFRWGNKDFVGENDPAVRNQLLGDSINAVTGVKDIIDTINSLDPNAPISKTLLAVAFGVAKSKTPKPLDRMFDKAEDHVTGHRGGAHGDMTKPVGDGLDSHHMPARQSNPSVHPNDGPAIQMDPHDHHLTSSNGRNGRAGAIYRAEVADMINSGNMRGAMAKEIRDVRRASLEGSGSRTKYNQAMGQMLDYAKSQGMLNK